MFIGRREVLGGIGAAALAAPLRIAADNVRDTLSPQNFGAIGDGNSDDTRALQKAFDATAALGGVLDLGRGVYKVTGSLVGHGHLRVVNSGGAVIRAAPGDYAQPGIINLIGTAAQIENLAANASRGAVTIKTSGPPNLGPGDLASIYNPIAGSWSSWRSYYTAGEFIQVDGVSGSSVHLSNPLYASYNAELVKCYKINPISGYLENICIESRGYTRDVIYIDYAKDFRIVRPRLRSASNSCIYISRSFGTVIDHPEVVNTGNGGDDYGIIVNGQNTRITGGNIMGRRHAVTTGGSNRVNDMPCRDLITTGAILRNDPASGVWAADFHGITEASAYIDCTIVGGISLQGKDVRCVDSRIYSMMGGVCCYGAEVVGGVLEMRGNTFYIDSDPFSVKRGVIDFGGNSRTAISDKTTQDVTITVSDNTFVSSVLGANTSLMMVRNRGASSKINIEFTDNMIRVNNFRQLVFIDLLSGRAASNHIRIDRNKCSLHGKLALYADANYSRLPVLRVERDGWLTAAPAR